MPAASLNDIFDFETQIETAISTALESAGLVAVMQRDSESKTAPLVAVQFQVGESLGSLFTHQTVKREDRFGGELSLSVATYRNADTDSHTSYRAKVRTVMSNWQTSINPLLSYLILLDCKTAGTTPQTLAEDDYDISSIRYYIPFAVRYDAWPS